MVKWDTILCPIDFSEISLAALRLARSLRKLVDARLVLVYVVEPIVAPSDFTFGPMTSGDVEDRLVERSRQSLAEIVSGLDVPSDKLGSRVEHGRASQEIVRVASEERADLIVMGTHGYTGMAHVLLGSTAERVLRKAPCPVLTVRAQTAPDSSREG